MALPPGTAPIKQEFLIQAEPRPLVDDDAVEGNIHRQDARRPDTAPHNDRDSHRKTNKEQRREKRGTNKGRRWGKQKDELDLCWRLANGSVCEFGEECRFIHDVPSYLSAKPRDIYFSSTSSFSDTPPFVPLPEEAHSTSIDPTTTCPVYQETGYCRHGLKCRFLGGHVRVDPNGGDLILLHDEEKMAQTAVSSKEVNFVEGNVLKLLRSKKYPYPIADEYVKEVNTANEEAQKKKETINVELQESLTEAQAALDIIQQRTGEGETKTDVSEGHVRFGEKKRLDWAGKTYLAPLTTVGNLPFRRLCIDYGADITCGEMGLATSFLAGSKEEWSLVRRHPSEKMFGVQVAGSKPSVMVPAAEVIGKELAGNVDFVDINCGCPIDLVFKTGSGSALLDAPAKLGKIIIGMNKALGDIPVTVKLRMGVKDGKNTAHKLMPRLAPEFGAAAITLHGRTRQQRYSKLADWDYIKQCVEAVRAREADEDLPPVPIFGDGDCYSSQDFWGDIDQFGCDGVMVARGALIKPWIFTEIKERREWDISARERLEHVKKFAEYGLSHFGTDTAGVNTTRRYLCEALSFQYRYIPIGLLERLPGRLNDRAPAFKARNDLETLLASGDSRDWVKISEMFLGPAPGTWTFTPKHKSNAYESQG